MADVVEWYKDVINNRSDPRTSNFFLMTSPIPVLTIVASYVYFCTLAGPRYMKNKKPYSLRNILLVYNFSQIIVNIYLVHEGLVSGWLNDYKMVCEPVDYSDNPRAVRMAKATHLYFITKVIDLLDTVFFVLRKKDQQITFLHVYHHTLMPLATWLAVKFVPGGHVTFMGLINSFVHVIMYGYYLLAALGPRVQKYLWWKKYLTILQLVQFVFIFLQNLYGSVTCRDSARPMMMFQGFNGVLFLFLFGSFYVRSYMKKSFERKPKMMENGSDVVSKIKLN